MAAINFVRNYIDVSTPDGFRFEFLCDRCGSGHLSTLQPAGAGAAGAALRAAVEEVRPGFQECPRCGQWVDAACWNEPCGLCIDCRPA